MKQWTLPQVLHAYIGKQEQESADARQQFSLTMAAIGSVFSKDGKKVARNVLSSLEGPKMSDADIIDQLDDIQRKVLYGDEKLEEMGYGTKNNSD